MSLFPGDGEGMVVDHICEPEALKHDALTIPPFSAIEGKNERLQWGVTSTARNKAISAILERQKQDAREYRKNLRPPAYLTAPDSKYFVDQCRFVKLGFDSIGEANEAGEGEVRATCSFALGDDNYWRVKGCHLVPKKGTSQEVMDASKRYLSSACWAKDNFHTELDKNGIGTKILTFSLGDE
ncbi:hypothetical protein DTJ15_00100 [Parasaccharibacter sp. TMW 2.1891]|nr:hypothetical protein [Parasaccharibacter sp. TMW 2.1891]